MSDINIIYYNCSTQFQPEVITIDLEVTGSSEFLGLGIARCVIQAYCTSTYAIGKM